MYKRNFTCETQGYSCVHNCMQSYAEKEQSINIIYNHTYLLLKDFDTNKIEETIIFSICFLLVKLFDCLQIQNFIDFMDILFHTWLCLDLLE